MQVIKECNCTDSSFLSLYKNVRQTKTNDEINCAFEVYQKFLSETLIKKYCLPFCKLFFFQSQSHLEKNLFKKNVFKVLSNAIEPS